MSASRIVTAGPGLHIGDYYAAETVYNGQVVSKDPHVIEGYRLQKVRVAGKDMVVGDELKSCACDNKVDISWLPFCAETYQISPNIHDFNIVSVSLLISSLPNRNLDAFPYDELTAWRPLHGTVGFQTWRGRPVHIDHDNADPSKAKGVILDCVMQPFRNHWVVNVLKAFDRSKDPKLAEQIKQRNRVGHSMGCLVERTECSIPSCRFISNGVTTCEHIAGGAGKGQIIRGSLVYELLRDWAGVESSTVLDPAWICAISDQILSV